MANPILRLGQICIYYGDPIDKDNTMLKTMAIATTTFCLGVYFGSKIFNSNNTLSSKEGLSTSENSSSLIDAERNKNQQDSSGLSTKVPSNVASTAKYDSDVESNSSRLSTPREGLQNAGRDTPSSSNGSGKSVASKSLEYVRGKKNNSFVFVDEIQQTVNPLNVPPLTAINLAAAGGATPESFSTVSTCSGASTAQTIGSVYVLVKTGSQTSSTSTTPRPE